MALVGISKDFQELAKVMARIEGISSLGDYYETIIQTNFQCFAYSEEFQEVYEKLSNADQLVVSRWRNALIVLDKFDEFCAAAMKMEKDTERFSLSSVSLKEFAPPPKGLQS